MMPIRSPRPFDYLLLIVLGAIWGAAFLMIEIALRGFQPLTVAAVRIFLGGAILVGLALLSGERWPRVGADWRLIVPGGLLSFALPFTLISWGETRISSSMAAILMACGPFFALVFSHLLTRDDRMTWPKLAGIALGFGGVVLLVGIGAVLRDGGQTAGQLAVAIAAACYAASAMVIRRLAHLPPLMGAGLLMGSAAIYMVPVALIVDQPWAGPAAPREAWAAILFLGAVPTAAAFALRFRIVATVGVTFVAQVSYLTTLFGVFWAWLVLDHFPDGEAWLALVLILLGLAVSRMPNRRSPAHRVGEAAASGP